MKELLTQYPKAAKIVKDYYLEKFMKGLEGKDFPPEYLEHVKQQGIQLNIVEKVLENSPRQLVDVFDENQLYLDVAPCYDDSNTKIMFFFTIHKGEINFEDLGKEGKYNTRIEAEKEAIKSAFEALESKLN